MIIWKDSLYKNNDPMPRLTDPDSAHKAWQKKSDKLHNAWVKKLSKVYGTGILGIDKSLLEMAYRLSDEYRYGKVDVEEKFRTMVHWYNSSLGPAINKNDEIIS